VTTPPGPYPPGSYPIYGSQVDSTPDSSGSDQAAFVIVAMLIGVAIGFLGGWVWAEVADPPQLVVANGGAYLSGELAYDAQVVVTLWFLVVGVVGGAVTGFFTGLAGRRHGAATVVAVLALTVIASALSAWVGIHVFGPDLTAELAGAKVGDLVTAQLSISTAVAYLGWPIGGLLGALAGVAFWPPERKGPQINLISGTVVGPSSPSWGN
jgi:hypothetical protein